MNGYFYYRYSNDKKCFEFLREWLSGSLELNSDGERSEKGAYKIEMNVEFTNCLMQSYQ